MDQPRIFVGYDKREAIAYHVCSQSLIETASEPISIHPLSGAQRDGTNAFTFSRYLVPHLCGYQGWAIFLDGDMVVDRDIAELWAMRHEGFAALVVKHEYKTRHPRKYLGTKMESPNVDYPRKNWSSVILWNCHHPANAVLTPEFILSKDGAYLHRFSWLEDQQISDLPGQWNYLIGEDPPGPAYIYHYTLGVPGIRAYRDCFASWKWDAAHDRMLECP